MPQIDNTIDDYNNFKIHTSTTDDVNISTLEYSLSEVKVDYSAFMSSESSILDNLLIDTMNISLPVPQTLSPYDTKCFDQSDDSSSNSNSNSFDSDDSDEENNTIYNNCNNNCNINNKKTFVKQQKPKITKKPQNENDKRALIMQLNQEYTNQLSALNDDVVRAYRKWKDLEKKGYPCEYAMKEWMHLNKKYTTLKRRNAREIFDKVQSLNRKMNVNTNVYDLHGQGVKCGNLQYILKRIFNNEEKKLNDLRNSSDSSSSDSDDEINRKFVLDIGNEKDGDWHKHAKLLVLSFLSTKKTKYQLDDEKRYVTIQL